MARTKSTPRNIENEERASRSSRAAATKSRANWKGQIGRVKKPITKPQSKIKDEKMVVGMKINVPAVCFGLRWAQQEHGKAYEKITYIGMTHSENFLSFVLLLQHPPPPLLVLLAVEKHERWRSRRESFTLPVTSSSALGIISCDVYVCVCVCVCVLTCHVCDGVHERTIHR